MKKRLAAFLIAAALLSSRDLRANDGDSAFQQYTLTNGLTVILHVDHAAQDVAAVNILYQVGSKDEPAGKNGFAHLFEHLMFAGSAHVPYGEFDRRLGDCGGAGNADTSEDRTDFYEVFPAECLEDILRMESDRMGFLKVSQESLKNQQSVVIQEKYLKYDDPGSGHIMQLLTTLMWDPGHPYRKLPIGSERDVNAATLEDVSRFHGAYYNPNNAILAIAGDIDPKATMTMVEKWFGTLPKGPTPPSVGIPQITPLPGARKVFYVDDRAKLTRIIMGYRVPSQGEEAEAVGILGSLFTGSRIARLDNALHYQKHLVISVVAKTIAHKDGSIFIIDATLAPGTDPVHLENAINEEIARIAQEGISDRELARNKASLKTARLNMQQSMGAMAAELTYGQFSAHRPDAFGIELAEMEKVKPDQIVAVTKKYLNPQSVAVIVVGPRQQSQQQ